jgi:hypothetical protein
MDDNNNDNSSGYVELVVCVHYWTDLQFCLELVVCVHYWTDLQFRLELVVCALLNRITVLFGVSCEVWRMYMDVRRQEINTWKANEIERERERERRGMNVVKGTTFIVITGGGQKKFTALN